MELDELEIGDARAGAIRHRNPVAGGDRGFVVSRKTCPAPPVASSTAGARPSPAPGVDRGTARRRSGRPRTISDRRRARARRRGRADAPTPRPERAADLAAGRVGARAARAATLCAAFAASASSPSASRSNAAPHVDQLRDVARAVLDQHAHRLLVAQAVARGHRVARVQGRRVAVADRGRDAALRVAGVALGGLRLGQDEDRRPRRRAPAAARRPAMPLPTMRNSGWEGGTVCSPDASARTGGR